MTIFSFSPFGYEGSIVTVEVDLRRGIPAIDIVGLADSAVKESRERMQAAIRNSGFEFPPERVLISLSPADLKKEGAGFDLPIALSVLQASFQNSSKNSFINEQILVMGELELSGNIRPVKGIHAAVATAMEIGIKKFIVPLQNANEARELNGSEVYGADSLKNAFFALSHSELFTKREQNSESNNSFSDENLISINGVNFPKVLTDFEFSHIQGRRDLVRGLQIAAAGAHNLIAIGAPGCGKTLAIQKFPALLPFLTKEESSSVTRIWSLSGLIKPNASSIQEAPFRMPHQTATIEGICGGGPNCRPGEISLAHNGVLFLDEASEFRSSVLQMLRVPLESGSITLSRAGRSTVYPADFQLLMSTNPCPCGNYGSKSKICLCSSKSIEQYWRKFSAPLLDRIDIRIFVDNEFSDQKSKSSSELREEIANGINMQRKRQNKRNSKLTPAEISKYCILSPELKKILDNAALRYSFSPRAIASCLKLARTIADMVLSEKIQAEHLQEAINLRKLCSNIIPDVS